MFAKQNTLAKTDSELWAAITAENKRQEDHIELIASENYVSAAVLEAQGSQLTNKYAEGYPGKRYYGGCEHVDVVEQLAIERGSHAVDFAGSHREFSSRGTRHEPHYDLIEVRFSGPVGVIPNHHDTVFRNVLFEPERAGSNRTQAHRCGAPAFESFL